MATFKQYKLKDGTDMWLFKTYLGIDPVTGKEITTTRRGFENKKQAQKALNTLLVDFEKNGLQKKSVTTFKEVYELWYADYRNTVKESTSMTTERHFNKHILPVFEKLRIDKVDVKFCQKTVNTWSKKFSMYKLLTTYTSKVFDYAVSLEIIDSNPVQKIIRPTVKKDNDQKKIKFYDMLQLQTFLNHLESKVASVQDGPLLRKYLCELDRAIFRLLSFSGIRVGEALALQWEDIDFANKTLTVNKSLSETKNGYVVSTTKTKKSVRALPIDEKTMHIIKRWQLRQRELLLANGQRKIEFVFTDLNNKHMIRNDIYQRSKRIAAAVDLPNIGCHGFRHTYASSLFESGANAKEIQEILGHTDIALTMNTYTHASEKVINSAVERHAKYANF
ncbi:site-specific integrase [Enterococcus rotai]|uniref:site-specific integrase n=1 Tax=Enterococcus rotai TaxID=118060 RepID=UPI0032B396AE